MNNSKINIIKNLLDKKQTATELQNSIVMIKFLDNKIAKLLNEIEEKTNRYSFWSNKEYSLSHTLLAYCCFKNFKHSYDGLFWSNEGYYWKYNNNKEIVKLIDDLFVYIRKQYYPELAHKKYIPDFEDDFYKYNTRYDYLNEINIEINH